jgi:hypothetical protein
MGIQDIPVNIGILKWVPFIFVKRAGEMENAREDSHDPQTPLLCSGYNTGVTPLTRYDQLYQSIASLESNHKEPELVDSIYEFPFKQMYPGQATSCKACMKKRCDLK